MINLSLVIELTKRDFTERFAGSVLGFWWSFIWPLVNLFIYLVVFGQLMGARLPGSSNIYSYGVYLSAGLIPWTALAGALARSSAVFLDKRHLITKIRLSLPSLLIYIILSETITFLITLALFLTFLLLTHWPLSRHLLLLPFLYYLQCLLVFGLGLLFATLTVFIRDLREVVGIVLQLWFWFTPIVYVKEILPPLAQRALLLNPAYPLIEAYQRIFVFRDLPALHSLSLLSLAVHLLILVSYAVFRYLERDLRDFL